MIPEIAEHFATVVRKRRAAGSYVAGRYVAGALEPDLEIQASVQPVSTRELLRLPEGLRTRATVAVITAADLRSANETLLLEADRIVHVGEEWEIVQVDDWRMGAVDQLGHLDCLAQRVDRVGAAVP